jgi:hypothetical protein
VRFYGKPAKKKKKGLGDRILDGAKRRRAPATETGRVWLGKVLAIALAGAAVGEVIGLIIGRALGSQEIGISIGVAAGGLAGTAMGEGTGIEALLAAILGGVVSFADYFVIGWGGLPFYRQGNVTVLGLAGVFVGVVIGRLLSGKQPSADGNAQKGS